MQIDVFLSRAHELAIERMRVNPALVEKAKLQLKRWRTSAGQTRAEIYWNEWTELLDQPVEVLAQAICADSDHGAVLRSVSPLSCLITQAERMQMLKQARAAT